MVGSSKIWLWVLEGACCFRSTPGQASGCFGITAFQSEPSPTESSLREVIAHQKVGLVQSKEDPKPCLGSLLERRQVWVTELKSKHRARAVAPWAAVGREAARPCQVSQHNSRRMLCFYHHDHVLQVAPDSQPCSVSWAPLPHSAPGRGSRSHTLLPQAALAGGCHGSLFFICVSFEGYLQFWEIILGFHF